jgi:hypothetical protein
MSPIEALHPTRLERAYMWPFLEMRKFLAALARYWRRILVGAFVGWFAAVVLGAVALALLEVGGVITRSTSDALAIVIVLGGTALGALSAYALRAPRDAAPEPEGRRVVSRRRRAGVSPRLSETRRPPASTRLPRDRGAPRPRETVAEQPRRRRSRAANR